MDRHRTSERFRPTWLKAVPILATAGGLYLLSLYHYLIFHAVVELFSIAIAWGVFALAWNSRHLMSNNYLLLLGIAYLFIGNLDLLHTLAFRGMNVFPGYGTDLPTQLWIASRYLESLTFFVAPFFLGRALNPRLALGVYACLFMLLLASLFAWDLFPACFVEDQGLTPFKIASEYLISAIFLGALGLLALRRQEFDPSVWRLVAWALLTKAAAGLAFTFYVDPYGLFNLVGHYFKVASFYLIYKAIIQTGLEKPFSLLFRELKQAEAALRRANDELEGQVRERTAALLTANAQLRQEIEERRSVEASLRQAQADLRRLTAQILQVQEQERSRISRELHDDLGQALIILKLTLSQALQGPGTEAGAPLHAAVQELNGLIEKVRRICYNLSPPILEDLGLEEALQTLFREFSANQGLKFSLHLEKVSPSLPKEVQVAVYRIFQEVLTNVSKHAEASEVSVTIARQADRIRFLITDNGRGFDPAGVRPLAPGRQGVGLASIRERVSMLGGDCEITSRPGGGTEVRFSLPLGQKLPAASPGTVHANL